MITKILDEKREVSFVSTNLNALNSKTISIQVIVLNDVDFSACRVVVEASNDNENFTEVVGSEKNFTESGSHLIEIDEATSAYYRIKCDFTEEELAENIFKIYAVLK